MQKADLFLDQSLTLLEPWSTYPGALETDISCFVRMMVHNNILVHQPNPPLLTKEEKVKVSTSFSKCILVG